MSFLYDCQKKAVDQMRDGCILNGGVGSGKSRTGLYYYFKEYGGTWIDGTPNEYIPMVNPPDLYIITTAMKRDKHEWEGELLHYIMSPNKELSRYDNTIVIDSWNNISKYESVSNAFFIFDEDRVTGNGAWVKSFYKIVKKNRWIILSATPGDTWEQYIPVFIANGFYRNKTEFADQHIIYNYHANYPLVDRYVNVNRLIRLRDRILVDIDDSRTTVRHHHPIDVAYDIPLYKYAIKNRVDPYNMYWIPTNQYAEGALQVGVDIRSKDVSPIMDGIDYKPINGDYVRKIGKPLKSAAELCYTLRKVVNSSEDRQVKILELLEEHPRAIIFYNYDYERDILLQLYYGDDVEVAEWNGHKHQPLPTCERWVYIVQYTAGSEGWNAITTDTIIFYSQNYSYKTLEQARGRIDRINTPYEHLHYFYLKSKSGIDLAISKALDSKKKFNETKWYGGFTKNNDHGEIDRFAERRVRM